MGSDSIIVDDRLWLMHFKIIIITFEMLCEEVGALVNPVM